MKNMTILDYPDWKIAIREDIYSLSRNLIKDFFEESGCNLFNHTINKNYRKEGHVSSSLGNNFDWLELYWNKYRNSDSSEKQLFKNIFGKNISILSYNIFDPNNECVENRLRICDIKNGFAVAITHENDVIESMSFGWKNDNMQELGIDKINKICQLLKPVRNFHLEKGMKIFSQKDHTSLN